MNSHPFLPSFQYIVYVSNFSSNSFIVFLKSLCIELRLRTQTSKNAIIFICSYPSYCSAILFNLQLGLRVGELCTLKKSDILFDEKLICINRTERSYKPLELVDGKIVEHTTIHIVCEGETKSNSNRVLPLSDEALTIIKEVLRLQEEMNIKSEFLFPHENGEHVLRERYNDILEHYCKKVSIPVKSIHKTRKTVFSKLFASGMGLDEVMAFSGHRDKATLIKHYLFATNDSEKQRTKVAKALSTGVGFANSF